MYKNNKMSIINDAIAYIGYPDSALKNIPNNKSKRIYKA
jgi:hypothetical protein